MIGGTEGFHIFDLAVLVGSCVVAFFLITI